MRRLLIGLLLALIALPAPVAATSFQSAPVSKLQLAANILALTEPEERVLQIEMRGWEAGVRAVLEQDPATAKLEAEYPGAIAAGVEAGRPIAAKYIPQAVATLRAKKAEMLASGLTIDELEEFYEFARSDAGQRFFSALQTSSGFEAVTDSVVKRASETGELRITESDAHKIMSKSLRDAQAKLSTADTLAVMKFNQSPVGKKIAVLGQDAAKLTLDFANNPDSRVMEEQGEAIGKAIIAFVEAKANAR